jgi:hypothetical protein
MAASSCRNFTWATTFIVRKPVSDREAVHFHCTVRDMLGHRRLLRLSEHIVGIQQRRDRAEASIVDEALQLGHLFHLHSVSPRTSGVFNPSAR